MSDDVRRTREEAHFYKVEQELLARLRKQADEVRHEQERRHRQQLHWMKCPKCGHDLKEIEMGPVFVDKCTGCAGIYLDAGEMEILLAGEQRDSLFVRLFGRKAARQK